MRLRTILIAMELMRGHFPIAELAVAQDRTMPYIQITNVKASGVLRLDPKNPASCGTADVNVIAIKNYSPDPKNDIPDPVVSVSMFGYVDHPPGVMVSVSPEVQSRKIAFPSASTVFTFKVCTKGNLTGNFTFQANIAAVKPATYQLMKPDPEESGRVTFDVVP